MPKTRLCVLLIAAIALLSIPSTQSTNGIIYERRVTLYSTGLILLEDQISGFTESDKPFTLRLPRNITDNMLDCRAETADGLNLNIDIVKLTENETVLEVAGSVSSRLKLFFLVNGSTLIGQTDPFALYIPVYPGLNIHIAQLNFTLTVPEVAEFKDYPSDFNKSAGKLWLLSEDLEPEAFRVERISIAGSPLIKVEEFSKTIIISEPGDVMVEEFYRILNVGSSTSQVVFNLPADACEADARDEFGKLQSSSNTEGDVLKLTVKPRYELRKGDRYSLTISYKFPARLLVEHSLLKDFHELNMELESALPMVARSLHVDLKLPSYSTIVDVKPENYTISDNTLNWILETSGHSPVLSPIRKPPTLTLNYKYNVLWSSLKPVLWTLCGLAVVATIYYVHKAKILKTAEVVSKVKPSATTKGISEFISAYEEKLNLRRELRDLESSYLAGNVSRAEYSTRSTKIKNRMTEIDKIIENLKPTIRLAGFPDEVAAIEEAETDLSICDVGLSELRNRYRTGKVSKHVYERLLNEYNKRIRSNENKIRRVVETISSS
ncbi:MAG: hypothetical protein QXI36_03030 [Candidatus Bathyarchaeia archaeon]